MTFPVPLFGRYPPSIINKYKILLISVSTYFHVSKLA